MKVVLFASAYVPAVGGVEELTRRLADHLVGAGNQVEVWTHRHPETLLARESIAGTCVRRFALPLPTMRAMDLARFPRTALTASRQLRAAVKQTRPDVVHVQCFSSNGVYTAALAPALGVPFVVSLQGETVMDDNDVYEHSRVLPAALRMGLRRSDAVTGCSQFVLDDAERRFGLPLGAGTVIPNGVDLSPREPPAPLALPFDRFVLGLGRFVEKKGFDLLLRAFACIAPDHPRVGLVIGGDGAARPALAQRAREIGLGTRVVLPGTLSRGQVAWAMEHASAFVLPSRVEPFGIVVLEALRAGVPVVVSSRGGAPEIVRHDRDGLVADPFDIAAMAGAIARLLDDEGLRRRLAVAARLRASKFSWNVIGERYWDIYRRVVDDRARFPAGDHRSDERLG